MTYRKKLIEVSLPLEAINKESAREKSIRHGHPSTLHLWWARRPLAACRAVLWASLVDDPSEYMPDEESARAERERLFDILEDLVKWENVNNEEVLEKARLEIARSVARDLGVDVPVGRQAIRDFLATQAPPVLDPFAGGGSIPLEAQRLGLRAYASDLNPVAVLINKALIEIPPQFADLPPVHPDGGPQTAAKGLSSTVRGRPKTTQPELWKRGWRGAQGLAEDVRYYGQWMREQALKRIGHLYPPVKVIREKDGSYRHATPADLPEKVETLTVIAWLWARTVTCPNPACGARMPLVRSFALSTKKGRQAWVEPVIEGKRVRFTVRTGDGQPPEGTVNRNGARCICCGTPVPLDHVRAEGKAGRMDAQMMAIVAEGKNGRIYLPPHPEHEAIAAEARPAWKPETSLPEKALGFRVQLYGMEKHADLFTSRQLTALTTFSDLVAEARQKALEDARAARDRDPEAYANAVATYLGMAVNRIANTLCTISRWTATREQTVTAFARQALPMTWDFPDVNPFAKAAGDLEISVESITKALETLPFHVQGEVHQQDAKMLDFPVEIMFSTDPPYYDNIGYADLSDFFYIWLRRSLGTVYPDLFPTLLVPKAQELVATPYRFGGDKRRAERFFEDGLRQVFANLRRGAHPAYPLTVYYAFKQSEEEEDSDAEETNGFMETARASTGWETMLEGLLASGFEITGTWPMRTELANRSVGLGTNALASSIVLVCRPRPQEAPSASRRDFLAALKKELPQALRELQQGAIAPVDLAQAAIGPGMAIFSRCRAVLESDGSPMRVRTALALINQALDEFLAEQEGEYDGDTRWALAWYEQFGHNEGPYGVAETLSKAKNTSVEGLVEAGLLEARGGKVRLLRREELPPLSFDGRGVGGEGAPLSPRGRGAGGEGHPTAWEAVQRLIYELDRNGEAAAASLLARLGGLGETARDLAYRLYTVCERKSWAQDALAYNMLVVAWPRLRQLAAQKEPGQERWL